MLKIDAKQKTLIKQGGNVTILSNVIEDTLEELTSKYLVYNKEDIRLYQGMVQALLAVKEVLP